MKSIRWAARAMFAAVWWAESQSGSSSGGQKQALTEFLVQMDGVGKDQTGILVLGATNVVGKGGG